MLSCHDNILLLERMAWREKYNSNKKKIKERKTADFYRISIFELEVRMEILSCMCVIYGLTFIRHSQANQQSPCMLDGKLAPLVLEQTLFPGKLAPLVCKSAQLNCPSSSAQLAPSEILESFFFIPFRGNLRGALLLGWKSISGIVISLSSISLIGFDLRIASSRIRSCSISVNLKLPETLSL